MTTLAILLRSDLGSLLPERARELAALISGSPEVSRTTTRSPEAHPHPTPDHAEPPPLPPLAA